MKKLLLACLIYATPWLADAQTPAYKNSVRMTIGATYVKGDQQSQSPVPQYGVIYSRQLGTSPWLVETGLSYTNRYVREQFTPFQFYFPGDRSQLVTADLNFMVNLLRSTRHTLRIGAGPSFWYVRNGIVNNLSGTTSVGSQQLESVSYTRSYSHNVNLAVNLRSDYEYALSTRVILGLRISTGGNVLQADGHSTLTGTLSTIGVSTGYRF